MAEESVAITDMLGCGLLQLAADDDIDTISRAEGFKVLFFSGGKSRRSDAHDVAVALREILKDYRGRVRALLVPGDDNPELSARYRVLATPSLVLLKDDAILEVIPRVRDWADYAGAFQRYLGKPGVAGTETN